MLKFNFKFILRRVEGKMFSVVLTVCLILIFGGAVAMADWNPPSQSPPDGNTLAPLHTGGTQFKAGGLGIGGLLRAYTDMYVSGKFGVGTDSPKEKLQVGSAFTLHDGGDKVIGMGKTLTGGGESLLVDDSYPAEIRLDPAGGFLSLAIDSEKRANGEALGYMAPNLVIKHDGNVGIGTQNPVFKLEVNGDIALPRANKIKFLAAPGFVGERAYIRSSDGPDYSSLVFAVGGGYEAMYISPYVASLGYVGIGTQNPTSKLEILGDSDSLVTLTRSGAMNPTKLRVGLDSAFVIESGGSFKVKNNDDIQLQATGRNTYLTSELESRLIANAYFDGTNWRPIRDDRPVSMIMPYVGNNSSEIRFLSFPVGVDPIGTGADPLQNATHMMTIKDGNVGIGTQNPTSRFSVLGNTVLLREEGPGVNPGPGPGLTLQSPSNETSTEVSEGPFFCEPGMCSGDDTPDSDINNKYICPPGSGGLQYDNDLFLNGVDRYTQKIRCIAGTSSYTFRVNEGGLEFLNNDNAVMASLNQGGRFDAQELCINGDCKADWGANGLWVSNGSDVYYNSGNVGIGTDSPPEKLSVLGDANPTSIEWVASLKQNANLDTMDPFGTGLKLLLGGSTEFSKWSGIAAVSESSWANSSGLAFYADESEKMRISNTGNVGIGTQNPTSKLEILGDSDSLVTLTRSGAMNPTKLRVGLDSAFVIESGGPLKIDSEGDIGVLTIRKDVSNKSKVGIWTQTPGYELEVNGAVGANSFLYLSDRRLKDNIVGLSDSLEKIMNLEGVSYDWKKDGKSDIGLVAQDVEKVFPEIIFENSSTGMKSVSYGKLVAPLIEAVKEQQREIEDLRGEIEKLKLNVGR